MRLDALAIACLVHELRSLSVPARVQQVLASDAHTLVLELYAQHQRRYLSLHVQGPDSGLALQVERPRRGEAVTSGMLELLRKYGRGGLLTDLIQPNPIERVVVVHLSHPQHGPTQLIFELTGRRSNLLLANPDRRILGQLHPVSSQASRPLRPGQQYEPPPLQNRLSPLDCSQADLAGRLLESGQAQAVSALTRILAGIGPTQAREIAYRTTGKVEAETRALEPFRLLAVLRELWAPVNTGQWQPSQVLRDDQQGVAAPFPIRYLPDAQVIEIKRAQRSSRSWRWGSRRKLSSEPSPCAPLPPTTPTNLSPAPPSGEISSSHPYASRPPSRRDRAPSPCLGRHPTHRG